MKEINDLDVFIRKKLAQRDHPFQEAYWEQAEALIEADKRNRKQRRMLFIWWGMGIMLMMILTAGLAYRYVEEPSAQSFDQRHSERKIAHATPSSPSHNAHSTQTREAAQLETVPTAIASDTTASAHTQSLTQRQLAKRPYSTEEKARLRINLADDQGDVRAGPIDPPHPAMSPPVPYDAWLAAGSYKLPLNQLGHNAQVDWLSWQEKRHGFALEAGWQWTPSWTANEANRGSFHPVIGATYHYWLSPAIRFQSGLRYTGRGALGTSYSFSDIERGFGQVRTDSIFTPKRLHQLEIPVRLEGRVAGRHYASIGLNGTWLLETTGTIEVSQRKTTAPQPLSQSTSRTGGLRYGFQKGDLQLVAGYGYYVGEGMMIRAEGVVGLRDMTDQAFFEHARFDRHMGLRLLFSYQFR